jgi:hypothetical protein
MGKTTDTITLTLHSTAGNSFFERAQAMTGDYAAARKSYEEFLTLWRDANPDLPVYKEAKAEHAALTKTRLVGKNNFPR